MNTIADCSSINRLIFLPSSSPVRNHRPSFHLLQTLEEKYSLIHRVYYLLTCCIVWAKLTNTSVPILRHCAIFGESLPYFTDASPPNILGFDISNLYVFK